MSASKEGVGCLKELVGVALVIAGAFLVLRMVAFASVVDPSLQDGDWWDAFFETLFMFGWGGLLVGFVLVVVGLRLFLRNLFLDGS